MARPGALRYAHRVRLTLIAAVLGGLAACALQADLTQSAPDPRAVLDAYLIAHGMASEYASREGADPAGEIAKVKAVADPELKRVLA